MPKYFRIVGTVCNLFEICLNKSKTKKTPFFCIMYKFHIIFFCNFGDFYILYILYIFIFEYFVYLYICIFCIFYIFCIFCIFVYLYILYLFDSCNSTTQFKSPIRDHSLIPFNSEQQRGGFWRVFSSLP